MVNRVIRDDPSKGGMHNREAISLKLLWKSLTDYDLWPMYLLGLTNHIPFATPNIYLTLSLRGLGFTTFQTNLLVIPSQLLHGRYYSRGRDSPSRGGSFRLFLTREKSNKHGHHHVPWRDHRPAGSDRGHTAGLVRSILAVAPLHRHGCRVEVGRVGRHDTLLGESLWCVIVSPQMSVAPTFTNGCPQSPSHPSRLDLAQLQHGTEQDCWCRHVQHVCSSVRSGHPCIRLRIQAAKHSRRGTIIAANIYQDDDAPRYTRGNTALLAIVGLNVTLYGLTKLYYVARNRQRERRWSRMSDHERAEYLSTTRDAGNKRLDFRFAS